MLGFESIMVDHRQHILTGYIFVHHTINCLYLSDDFFKSAVQIIRIHALFHDCILHIIWISNSIAYEG